ncbi:MAG: hypothetical protein R2941_23320 [Desulfobacterales bacterium]
MTAVSAKNFFSVPVNNYPLHLPQEIISVRSHRRWKGMLLYQFPIEKILASRKKRGFRVFKKTDFLEKSGFSEKLVFQINGELVLQLKSDSIPLSSGSSGISTFNFWTSCPESVCFCDRSRHIITGGDPYPCIRIPYGSNTNSLLKPYLAEDKADSPPILHSAVRFFVLCALFMSFAVKKKAWFQRRIGMIHNKQLIRIRSSMPIRGVCAYGFDEGMEIFVDFCVQHGLIYISCFHSFGGKGEIHVSCPKKNRKTGLLLHQGILCPRRSDAMPGSL